MDVEERFNKWKQKYGLALGNNATQLPLIIAGDAIATLKAEQREHAALIKEIEARAPEQGGEMREALKRSTYHLRRLLPQCGKQDMNNHDRDLVEWCEVDVPAIIARESAEPAEKRGPEVDALLWMAEHLMGSSVAMTMRGWLAEYRATGKLVVRDADGTVKDSLTVASKERQ